MSDTIYREDAILWVKTECNPYGKPTLDFESGKKVIEHLEHMPSADNEVVGKLKTAIESEELCKNCPTAERISRENLLGAMALGFSYGINADRPQGEWIEHKWAEEVGGVLISNYECSECHSWERRASNFCPSCGARMKGADDEMR